MCQEGGSGPIRGAAVARVEWGDRRKAQQNYEINDTPLYLVRGHPWKHPTLRSASPRVRLWKRGWNFSLVLSLPLRQVYHLPSCPLPAVSLPLPVFVSAESMGSAQLAPD